LQAFWPADDEPILQAPALARIGAAALHAIGVRGGGERAGSEDRGGRCENGTLGHESLPYVGAAAIRRCGSTNLHPNYAHCQDIDQFRKVTLW
jgi:hypothetical protein